jgi:agmatinase
MKNLYFVSNYNEYKNNMLFNSVTNKHIFCNIDNSYFLNSCLSQQLRNLEENNYKIILQLATAELLYRGILVPLKYKENEEEYLESISLFMPPENNFFKADSISEDLLVSINKPSIIFCDVATDAGATRPGTRFGPSLLRSRAGGMVHRSNKFSILDLYQNKIIEGEKKIFDLGSINIDSLSCIKTILEKIEKAVDKIPSTCIPIFIGGDHLMSYPLIKSTYKKHPNLHLVQLDNHLDLQLWGDFEKGKPTKLTKPAHSNFISWLKSDIPDLEITQIGINSYQSILEKNNENALEYLNAVCSNRISNLDILLSEDYIEKLPKSKEIYLTIDVDILSSVFMPVTGFPAGLGIYPDKFLKIIDYITKNNKIVGIDIMEFGSSNKFDVHLPSADIICSTILMILGNLL